MDANQVEMFSGSQLREVLPGHPSNGSFQLNVLPGVSYTLAARTLELGASTLLGVNRYNATTVFGNQVTLAGGSQFFDTLATAGFILPGETRNVGNLAILGCGGGGGNLPDLILTEFNADTVGESGEPIQVFVRILNRGPLPAGPFRLGFYLSQDGILSPGEVFAACTFPSGLSSGFGTTCSGSPSLPDVAPGDYYLAAIIDDLSQVTELDENNNIRFTEQLLTVGQVPPPTAPSTTGVFRPSNGALFLKSQNTAGFADRLLTFGLPGDKPVAGDWDGDGIDTIGVFRGGVFYLRNSNTNGFADLVFGYGVPTDLPIVGDWNGDGVDTIGVFRNGLFILRNSNTTGPAEAVFGLGIAGDIPISGDWNGDGVDTVGIFRPSTGALFLKNQNSTGFADIFLTYGLPGDKPVTGDWDGNGTDTIGVFRNGVFLLRNSNTNGFAEIVFGLGVAADEPISGLWGPL
jgi:hypothetical protein